MLKKLLTVLTVILGGCSVAFAQNITVTGTVTDQAGIPVIGAFVQVTGSTTGTMTGDDGSYSVDAPADGTLSVSIIGYVDRQVPVNGRSFIDIVLEEDTQLIDEVIVVAFGTATKESFTGSATVVNSDEILKVQSSDVTRALEGMVAGVQMTTASGSLGESPQIMIRGVGSINAGTTPLYVVDGVPYSGDMNNLNPSDIESMTILKDAASNALYGARGANGVIMITTKKAKTSEAVVNVDAKWGINTKALREYDYITDPAGYYEAHYAALYNYYRNGRGYSQADAHNVANATVAGSSSEGGLGYQVFTYPETEAFIGTNGKVNPNATLGRKVLYNGKEYWLTPDNWLDETYRASLRQEYNVNVSGVSGRATFFASF